MLLNIPKVFNIKRKSHYTKVIMKKETRFIITDTDWEQYLRTTPDEFLERHKEALFRGKKRIKQLDKLLYNFVFDPQTRYAAQRMISKNTVMYRARIFEKINGLPQKKDDSFLGYGEKDSFVPPKRFANEGRINKKKIVYLYVASSIDAAIAEISPAPSQVVSIAEIKAIEDLILFNIACLWSGIEAGSRKRSQWINIFILRLTECFYSVLTKERNYCICQYVGNFAKKYGFDGIRYFSSKDANNMAENAGVNGAIFNYKKCKPVSSKLVYICEVKYDYLDIK